MRLRRDVILMAAPRTVFEYRDDQETLDADKDDDGDPEDKDEEILLALGYVTCRMERALRQRQLAA